MAGASMGGASGIAAAGVAGVAAVGVAAWVWQARAADPAVADAPTALVTQVPQVAAPEDPTSAPDPAFQAPQVDVVRVETDGSGLIAGQAMGHGAVRVMENGGELARAAVDASGHFVIFLSLDASADPRQLEITQDDQPGAVATVIIGPIAGSLPALAAPDVPPPQSPEQEAPDAPPATGEAQEPPQVVDVAATEQAAPEAPSATGETQEPPQVVDAAPAAQVAPDARPATGEAQEPPQVADAASTEQAAPDPSPATSDAPEPPQQAIATPTTENAPTEPTQPEPSAPATTETPPSPTVLVSDETGVRALTRDPVAPEQVSIGTVSYSGSGAVTLAGQTGGADAVRLYLDNRPVATIPAQPSGDWTVTLPDIDAGSYTLRVDAVDDGGAVVSRVESPFQREEPLAVAALLGDSAGDVALRTVQPGNTLWAIARDRYGEGVMYVHVFEANKDLIRDPDLIFPGQIFTLPDL